MAKAAKVAKVLDAMAKAKKFEFTENLIVVGSKFFALSNLGQDRMIQVYVAKNGGVLDRLAVIRAWDYVCSSEEGYDACEEERKWWATALRTGRGKTSAERTRDRAVTRKMLIDDAPALFGEVL